MNALPMTVWETGFALSATLGVGESREAKKSLAGLVAASTFDNSMTSGVTVRGATGKIARLRPTGSNETAAVDQIVLEGGTKFQAVRLAAALPSNIPPPSLVVEDDGDVSFDWDFGPGRVFSVSVRRDGTLNYAWIAGLERQHGTTILRDNLPEAIQLGLRLVSQT